MLTIPRLLDLAFSSLTVALILTLIARSSSSLAETAPQPEGLSLGDKLENLGRLYKNSSDPVVQELWLLGRYHGQYHWSEANTGEDDGYESRRTRLGSQARIFENATLHAQMVSGSDIQPFYNGFTELWAQWSFSPEIALTIGQQKNRFTHDRNASSRYLNYLERAMVTNMFNVDYTPAVTLQGTVRDTSYYTGVFSNATGPNMGRAFGDLDSGYSLIAAVYRDLGTLFRLNNVTAYTSYIHSNASSSATNMNNFDDGLSSALIITEGHSALVSEVTAGIDGQRGNVVGLNLQPSYFFNRSWQLATRYQIALSNSSDGLNPQRRYEREIGMPAGQRYQAGYLGLNYYIAKHRLKLMTGVEYSRMDSAEAWTASTMARFYFGPHSGGAFPMNQISPFEYD
jgi:phosphate-selective porin OprO/OprP